MEVHQGWEVADVEDAGEEVRLSRAPRRRRAGGGLRADRRDGRGDGRLRDRLRRREQPRARADGHARRGPRLRLRLADRRHDPARSGPARRGQPAALRPARARRRSYPAVPGGGAGSGCCSADETPEQVENERVRAGAARASRASGRTRSSSSASPSTRSARAGQSAGARAGCCSPATPRTRCRRSPGRACARGSATRSRSTGSWTSCCKGSAHEQTLDAYTSERRAHLQHAIALSVELGKVICIADEAEAAARDEVLLSVAADPNAPPIEPPAPNLGPGIHDRRAGAGAARCSRRGAPADGCVEDTPRAGLRAVRARRRPPDELTTAARLAHLGGARRSRSTRSTRRVYRDWFAAHGCAAALVRPDFYVFGTATDGRRDAARWCGACRRR